MAREQTAKDAARLLPKAEKDSLDQVAARGDITQQTKAILDCGCGWGSPPVSGGFITGTHRS